MVRSAIFASVVVSNCGIQDHITGPLLGIPTQNYGPFLCGEHTRPASGFGQPVENTRHPHRVETNA